MELTNTFTVDLPVDATWDVLNDLERIIPCLPGAAVIGVDGDAFEGAVKIKVGPVSMQYRGVGEFVEKDRAARRAVIRAEGKDVGGQGGAKATVTATLSEQGTGTKVAVLTDLALSGRAAQFGRGVIADVSNKILGQFAKNLQAEIAGGHTATPATPRSIDDVEPLDVMGSMGGVLAKYALPVVGGFLAVVAGMALFGRRGGTQPVAPIVINLVFPKDFEQMGPSR